ncbi:hypothetical protein [Haloplasma contractile]|uniref:Uncharacterized protein n=1 Tax=Haloplasma contractile SSD-17B TaxID=1033810 RepID=U2E8M7_9MOLU|nr:hypothetical protein [Haloplasma contractile]ERJ11503.1 hypothetical protein HLPCO_002415 [Haloplasma contractile SSD-17B]
MHIDVITTILNESTINHDELELNQIKETELNSNKLTFMNTFNFLKPEQTYKYYEIPTKNDSNLKYMIALDHENDHAYMCEEEDYSLGHRILLLGQYNTCEKRVTRVKCREQSDYERLYRF